MRWLAALLLLAAGMAPATALAATYSDSDWTFGVSLVVLRVSLPDAAAAAIAGPGIPAITGPALAAYVAAHVAVRANAIPCEPIDQGEGVGLIDTLAASPGLHRFEVMFGCPIALRGATVLLQDRILFDRTGGHVAFARILRPGQAPVLRTIDAANQTIAVTAAGRLAGTGLLGFARIGWAQFLASASRLACLASLLLALRRRQDALHAGAGIVAGLLLATAIGAGGVWALRPDASETVLGLLTLLFAWRAAAPPSPRAAAAVAAAIVLFAAREWLIGHGDDAGLLLAEAALAPAVLLLRAGPAAPLGLLAPAALFGLLNGAAFAAAIAAIGLPAPALALPLAGHALGAALACAALATLAIGARRLAQGWTVARPLAFDLTAAGLVGLGAFWFVSRLHA